MKKLLLHFDTDPIPSAFDAVVAYDGGIDHLMQYAGVTPDNCQELVKGAIFTRAPKDKRNTAIFIGGSDLSAGQTLLDAVTGIYFQNFRVSVMMDSNGCNTTAAACVALLDAHTSVAGKKTVVLAGTGPVGQRIAAMLALSGAKVRLSSRALERSQQACISLKKLFGVEAKPVETNDDDSINAALDGCEIVVGAGKGGVQLLSTDQWQTHPDIKVLADVNTQLPLGFEGIDMMDKATERNGKTVFGGIGIGALKLKLHRQCIRQLFESNEQVLDAAEVLELARRIVN